MEANTNADAQAQAQTGESTVGRGTVVVPLLGQRAGAARLDAQRRGVAFGDWVTRGRKASRSPMDPGAARSGQKAFRLGWNWAGLGGRVRVRVVGRSAESAKRKAKSGEEGEAGWRRERENGEERLTLLSRLRVRVWERVRADRGRGRAQRGQRQTARRTEMDSQSSQQSRGCLSCSFEAAAPSARCICGV